MRDEHEELDRAAMRGLLSELEPLRARVQELERRLAVSERRVAELETAAQLSLIERKSRGG